MNSRFVLGLFASFTVMGSAFAADLPTYKAPPAAARPPAWSWTGCHVGANIGAGWQLDNTYDPSVGVGAGGDTPYGVLGGGQIGCDYQVGSFVFGLQGLFDFTGISGSHIVPPPSGTTSETFSTKTTWLSTETARVGYTITPQTLLYIRGGLAAARFTYTDADPTIGALSPYVGTGSAIRLGGTIGAGAEYAFTPTFSVFGEYDYVGFGSDLTAMFYTAANPANAGAYAYKETHDIQTFTVGVNYKFY